jgi:hypothetical protein
MMGYIFSLKNGHIYGGTKSRDARQSRQQKLSRWFYIKLHVKNPLAVEIVE